MSDHVTALKAIVENMPPDGSVTLPVAWLRELLAQSSEPGQRLLTIEQAAELVGRSPSTVRTWLNQGELEGFKLNGKSWRIRESAVHTYLAQQEAGEHEPPTVASDGPTDLGAWRKHVEGAA